MQRTVEAKLYLSADQEATLTAWLRECRHLYNQALEQRIKAYRRRKETIGYVRQCAWLTGLRGRIESLRDVPMLFARDALRRLDRAFDGFFRRLRAGDKKPGFPRFKPATRYNSLEYLKPGVYLRDAGTLYVPKLGVVRCRAGGQDLAGTQKLLRLVRRASVWFVQVLLDDGQAAPPKVEIHSVVGVDVGLESFATLDTGEKVPNPRCLRHSERKLKHAQRRVARSQRRSRNRVKAVRRLRRVHERIAAQRRDFCHREARKLVNSFDCIAHEDLNVKGLAKSRLAKSVHDAAWGLFLGLVACKAAGAGKHTCPVDPRGTSQECPYCGRVAPKSLSERVHHCPCGGPVLDRDWASALVIRARALRVVGASACGGSGLCDGSSPGVSRPVEAGSPMSALQS
jgi:putative transposase